MVTYISNRNRLHLCILFDFLLTVRMSPAYVAGSHEGSPMSIRSFLLVATLVVSGVVAAVTAHAADPTTHLKCYKAKDPLGIRGPGPAWMTLGAGSLSEEHCRIVGGFRLVCLPTASEITLPLESRIGHGPFTPMTPQSLPFEEVLTQNRLCYKLRCLERPNIDSDTSFTDEFGERKLTRYKPFLICGPAEASLCGDGNLDYGEECDDGNHVNGDCCNSNCLAEANTQACGPDTDGNECTTPFCDGAGSCVQAVPLSNTTPCTDSDGESCTQPRCDGSGTCVQAAFLPSNTTPCGDTDSNVCTQARCDGAGACDQNGFFSLTTTACTDDGTNPCNFPRCDGAGNCNQNGVVSGDGTPCPDDGLNPCMSAQCISGACDQTVEVPLGTACPNSDADDCNQPGCDESGVCAQDFYIRNCDIPLTCNPTNGVCE